MPLWEDFDVITVEQSLAILGREGQKLRYLYEVQAGLERTVVFHHKSGEGLEVELKLSFDWMPVRRSLDPDVLLILGSDGSVAHPVYAIVPAARSIVELDVHAAADIPRVDTGTLLARYLREIEAMVPSVSADRQGEVYKHLKALQRITKPAA